MKKVLVATGSSENKKKFAVDFINEYITKKGIDVEVIGSNIYEVKISDINPDVIVTIGPVNFNTEIPMIQGTCFVTKIGMESVCDSIIEKIK